MELAEELHKPIVKKILKITVSSAFKGKVWGAALADMQSISKLYKGFRFWLCVIDIFGKCAQFVPLKDKKDVILLMHFKRS